MIEVVCMSAVVFMYMLRMQNNVCDIMQLVLYTMIMLLSLLYAV